MFTITKDWLLEHRTPRGSWNYKQLKSINIDVPPASGWMDKVDGTEITDKQREQFEILRVKRGKKKKSPTLKDVMIELNTAMGLLDRMDNNTEIASVRYDIAKAITRISNILIK